MVNSAHSPIVLEPIWKRWLSFGITTKLILALTLMVSFACAATVWFIDMQLTQAYQQIFQQQFDSQWRMFVTEESVRLTDARIMLQAVLDRASDLSDKEKTSAKLFQSKLAEILLTEVAKKGYRAGGLATNAPFFAWISPSGALYKPVLADVGYEMLRQPDILQEQVAPLVEPTGDRRAYLVLPVADGSMLYQLLSIQIPGEGDMPNFGNILLGMPLKNLQTLFGPEGEGLQPGIVLSNQLMKEGALPHEGAQGVQDFLWDLHSSDVRLVGDSGHSMVGGQELYYRKMSAAPGMPNLYQLVLFSLESFHSFRTRIRLVVMAAVSLIPLSGLILSIVVSRRMTRPVLRLVEATERLGAGDFNVRVPEDRRDELGLLSGAFNRMAADLALKDKYRNILDQLADKDVAQQLLQGEIELRGEERDVSLIFCDVRGFTHLSEDMDPTYLLNLLNEHMTAMTQVAHLYHGVVDKFIGDAIMVIFGTPRSYGMDALHAAEAALAMQAKRKLLNQVAEVPFEIGIGIASGKVVAGCMGSSERLNYTVVGGRVNLASRLCSKAAPGEVLIDEATRARLGPRANVEALPPVTLKGISYPVPVFSLKGLA